MDEPYPLAGAATAERVFDGSWAGGQAVEALARRDLAVEGICKSFHGLEVLRDVSFLARSGEFLTLLGPSGCGKTTLLRIVAGLELPDRGRVVLSGEDITSLSANRRPVNTVFQSYALFPHLNVFENVAFGLRARRFAQAEVARRVGEALALLHLAGFDRRHTGQLSGGEKQRVALARALVNEPDVLLLDEPMSALDAKLRAEVQLELRRLQRRIGKTFLLVTHDQDEAMTVSDRILVMREGRIEQAGPPMQVYDHPVNRFVAEFLGLANLIAAWRADGQVRTDLGVLAPRTAPAWQRGTLAIRPERIGICAERPAQNGVSATVTDVIYGGDHLEVFVQPGPLRVRAAAGTPVRAGARIWLELPCEHLEALVE